MVNRTSTVWVGPGIILFIKLNFLLPLLVGGPDMANKMGPVKKIYTNYINKFNKLMVRHYSTEVGKNDLGSYLAGLFEGDGHI
jgi:hypothetical protein